MSSPVEREPTPDFRNMPEFDVGSVPVETRRLTLYGWARGSERGPLHRIGESCGNPDCGYRTYGVLATDQRTDIVRILLARPQTAALAETMGPLFLKELGRTLTISRIESLEPLRVASLVDHPITSTVRASYDDFKEEGRRLRAPSSPAWEVLRSLRDALGVAAVEVPSGGWQGRAFLFHESALSYLTLTRVDLPLIGGDIPRWARKLRRG